MASTKSTRAASVARRERAAGTGSPITLVDAYGLTKKQLAETIGLAPEALYKRGRLGAAKTQTRLREMAEILLRVSAWAGGTSAGHGVVSGRADPRLRRAHRRSQLVKSGQAAALRDYLDSIAMGGFA